MTVPELVEILSQSTRDFYRFDVAETDSQKSNSNWPGPSEQPATRSNRACGEVIGAATLAVMTACCRLLILSAITSSILPADLTIKVRTIAGNGQARETTEYYKENLMRRDFGPTYQLIDFSTGRSVTVDPAKKEYYPFDGSKASTARVVDPSQKFFIETTCFSTGEERAWFGYAAHRYVTTKKSHDEVNGKSSEVRETKLDSWILDFPVPPQVEGIASPNANFVIGVGLAGGIIKVPDVRATHVGAKPKGLVVWLKTDQYESEVVALSAAPLDQSLFDVPKGFGEIRSRAIEAPPQSWIEQIVGVWLRFLNSLFRS